MNTQEMKASLDEAQRVLNAADSIADDLAKMLVGRLRHASKYHTGAIALDNLKRELRDCDINTQKWKNES